MYFNEEHKRKVEERGDGYKYIGSYKCKEVTIDGKYSKSMSYIRVKCPYCFVGKYKVKCKYCCNSYENSLAYHIQQELKEPLNKYWDWEKNTVSPYHISKSNDEKVWIKCTEIDYHGSYLMMVSGFKRGSRCPYCAGKKVHPKDSFGQWLVDEFGKDAIEKYWSPRNTLNPFSITSKSGKKVWILCQEKDYHNDYGGYLVTPDNFYNGNRCPYCVNQKVHPKDSFGQWLIDTYGDDAIEKYWSPKNIINPFELAPKSTTDKIWILCQEKDYHNDNGGYLVTQANFYNGNRCPYCNSFASHKVHKLDSFGELYPEKAKYWSENNKKSPYEVSPRSNIKYKFICKECGKEFKKSLDNLNKNNYDVFCKECSASKLEQLTKEILDKYNIEYKREYYYENLIGLGKKYLRFDFYLPYYNTLIECQGEQHEHFCKGLHKTKKDFEKQLEHDKRKKQYAKEHNINLLEIWYYDIDNIENILINELNL